MTMASAITVMCAGAASAADYPVKPIKLITGFAAGGPSDVGARTVAQKITEAWGQQVIIDIRTGAGGNIATEMAMKAPPDGYTLLLGVFAHAVNQFLYPNLPFDMKRDFVPVILFSAVGNMLMIHPSIPAHSIKELVAVAMQRPGQLTAGSAGVGTASHLAIELMNVLGGIKVTHVPYKGLAPAHVDVVGGQISMLFDSPMAALPRAKQGRVRVLATTAAKRWYGAPEIPTMAESGMPGYEVNSWHAVFAPAGTPKDIVQRLNTVIARGLKSQDARERLASFGGEPMASSPEEFDAYLTAEMNKWKNVVKDAGMRAE